MSCPKNCRCGWKVFTVSHKGVITRLAELLDSDIGVIDPDQVAYIILESVQGEGGYNFPAPGFLQEVATIAKKYQISLIFDEIQSSIGRTGKWFAFEHFDIEPDVVTLAKSLRVGATVARLDMFSKEQGRLGGTWGGADFISSAIGYRVIEIIERDQLLDNAVKISAHFLSGLKEFELRYSMIRNTRGLGLMLAITLDGEGAITRLVTEALKRGLLIFPCGNDSIRFLPPLDVTIREVDLALEILDSAFSSF